MRRITSSLTYANVVSTLCLFILLGGGAYAARRAWIDGNDLKPRSVGAGKIRDTLTGRQINESRLGRVPDAAALDGKPASAFQPAGSYQPAGNYQPAGSYLAADGTAANAAKLGGQDPSAFVSASRVLSGSGTTSATTPETILTYAPLGITLTTDGDVDSQRTIRIVNGSGTSIEIGNTYEATINVVGNGGAYNSIDLVGTQVATWVLRQTGTGDPKRGLMITCGFDFSPNVANCVAFGIN